MEVFEPSRSEGVAELIVQLKALGLSGRDAAYLASALPPSPFDPQADACFRRGFRFMVAPERREEAARLVVQKDALAIQPLRRRAEQSRDAVNADPLAVRICDPFRAEAVLALRRLAADAVAPTTTSQRAAVCPAALAGRVSSMNVRQLPGSTDL